MERQYTSTVYIFQNGKVLLLYHTKHGKWVGAGGHVEANETPPEAARREALEETGIEIEFISQENVWHEHPHSVSIERPYLIALENIPTFGGAPPHQHIDFIYLARPKSMQSPKEKHDIRWFTLEEIKALQMGVEVFPEIVATLEHIFTTEMALI